MLRVLGGQDNVCGSDNTIRNIPLFNADGPGFHVVQAHITCTQQVENSLRKTLFRGRFFDGDCARQNLCRDIPESRPRDSPYRAGDMDLVEEDVGDGL